MNSSATPARAQLHPQERTLLVVTAIHLVFLPWAFGTTQIWSQCVSFALAVIGLAIAIAPRDSGTGTDFRDGKHGAGRGVGARLVRFPLFWLGGALLVLIVIQARNPAWQLEEMGGTWQLTAVDHIRWLPAGTDAPFSVYNGWRPFLAYASAWLVVCSLWVGITRRHALRALLFVLGANGLLIAALAVAQRAGGSPRILGLRQFNDAAGFGSFIDHNHGAAFVALMALVVCALGALLQKEARQRAVRSSTALVWLMAAAAMGLALFHSGSGTGVMLFLLSFVMAMAALVVIKSQENLPLAPPRPVNVILAVTVIAYVGFIVAQSDFFGLTRQLEAPATPGIYTAENPPPPVVRQRAVGLLGQHWLKGTGAGSFRYLFPIQGGEKSAQADPRAFSTHATSDWLQIPIELGLIGSLLIAAALVWCAWRWTKDGGWRHPVAVMLFLGCIQTFLHGLIDSPLQNPAILVTWWTAVLVAVRWLELDAITGSNRQPVKWQAPNRPEFLEPLKLPVKKA